VLIVNAVLGNLVVSAIPAMLVPAGVVVPFAVESALVAGWLVAPVLAAGGGLVGVVVVGGRELPSVAEEASVSGKLVGLVAGGGLVVAVVSVG
jgi:hypothetical protein